MRRIIWRCNNLQSRPFSSRDFIRQAINTESSLSTVNPRSLYIDNAPGLEDRIYVAMSGGVDSSMAAALLKQNGHKISGVFMRNWTDDDSNTPCRSEKDWQDVQDVCDHLKIPCERVDLSREYWIQVFQPALDVYACGNTPNPDVACNREIKFGKLFERLKQQQPKFPWWLATGHYARSARMATNRKPVLLRSKDPGKDQTFYLSQISQESLARTIFPLAPFTKSQVRQLAKSLLPRHIAEKPDSQGLCFVEPSNGRHFSTFLKDYLPEPKPAVVRLETGEVVGEHPSIWLATIGERSRLNFRLSQIRNPGGQWYVASKSVEPPSYTIVPGRDHPNLYCRSLIARGWRWIDKDEDWTVSGLVAQVRHRAEPVGCTVEYISEDNVRITFENEGVYGVTPGQAVAIWLHDRCLGGGIIDRPS